MNLQIYNFLAILNDVINTNSYEKNVQIKEPVDWEDMSALARKHNLLPIFVEGAEKYDSYRNYPGYARDMQDAMVMVAVQTQKSEAFLDLYTKFLDCGVSPIVIKGIVVRQLYGVYREHRVSGDEDIFIRTEEYEQVRAILENEGYCCKRPTLTKQQIEQIHEIVFYNEEKDFKIEVHLNIIGKENDLRTYMNDIFKNVFDQTEILEIDGVPLKVMDPTQSFLYLVFHAFKHFQRSGIGIRQMLDILLYKDAYHERIIMEQIEEPLRKTYADIFLQDMLWIGNHYFNQSFEVGSVCSPQELLEDLIQNGVFGGTQKTDVLAMAIRFNMSASGEKRGKIQAIITGVFPTRAQLMNSYSYLVEKPWLLPFAWIQRFRKFTKYAGKNMGQIVRETLKKVERREPILRKYKM